MAHLTATPPFLAFSFPQSQSLSESYPFPMPFQTAIHWFRRDLRLRDNPALLAGAQESHRVVPVYILSDWKTHHGWTGTIRQTFLCGCLESLSKNLASTGSRLILRCGRAVDELRTLIRETRADAVFFNEDYDPFGREMQKQVRALCAEFGIECRSFKERVLHDPNEVMTGSGTVYRVYTPYSKNWLSLDKPDPLPAPKSLGIPPAADECPSLDLPTTAHWHLAECTASIPAPGERAARERMKTFVEGDRLLQYAQKRNIPAGHTTSELSQDLRFGLIGIRELYARVHKRSHDDRLSADSRKSIETYIKELAWREFYFGILYHYPEVFETEFNPDWQGIPWPGNDADFDTWTLGRTGFPIVDAGMRQLLATGYIHNRVRMIVSMFLTKDLHCHWRLGESHFMRHLVDGENASNNGGWQWSAGTGADAAPYFRIQNPWSQTKRYDPDGDYIRTWVPELKHLPGNAFLEPPADGHPIAPDYPAPMVDHSTERDRCLARFAKHKEERR